MATVVSDQPGPSYASAVLNASTMETVSSNKENLLDCSSNKENKAEEEEAEGFVPVVAHGRKERRTERKRSRSKEPRVNGRAEREQVHTAHDREKGVPQVAPEEPKKFVEAPLPKVNPWQVRYPSMNTLFIYLLTYTICRYQLDCGISIWGYVVRHLKF